MSSGSFTLNNYTSWTTPSNSWYGSQYSKSWAGDDAPKRVKSPRIPVVLKRFSRKRGPYEKTIYIRDPNAPAMVPRKFSEHNYTKTIKEYYSELVTYRPSGWTSDRTVATFGTFVSGSWTDDSRLSSVCLVRAQSKLRSKVLDSDFNAAVVLGEMNETLRLIGDSAIRIAKSLWHLRRGDWVGCVRSLFDNSGRKPLPPHLGPRPRRKVVRQQASMWLELQYGWLPFYSDVKAAAEAFASWRSQPMRMAVRMGAEQIEIDKTDLDMGTLGVAKAFAFKKYKVSHKVTFKERPSLAYSLGLLDPVSVAWELLPLSFVLDWFIPIGQYLEATSSTRGVSIETVVTSKKFVVDLNIPFTRNGRYVTFNRTVGSTFPSLPLPTFKGLREAASMKHCANGIALLSSVFTDTDLLTPRAFR